MAKAPDTMALWSSVEKTDPTHTKRVNQRGGFTAISAHYQVKSATAAFGPVGIGWGYENGAPIFHDNLVFVPVTLWHGDRGNTFGPLYGGAEWRTGNRMDSDALKKAATDGLTKALSHLGFNADVFLGLFDDNKYVAEREREFSSANDSPPKREKLAGPITSMTALKMALRTFVHDIEGCGDLDQYEACVEASKPLIEQAERDASEWMHGGETMPAEFVPLVARMAKIRSDLEAAANDGWRNDIMRAG